MAWFFVALIWALGYYMCYDSAEDIVDEIGVPMWAAECFTFLWPLFALFSFISDVFEWLIDLGRK